MRFYPKALLKRLSRSYVVTLVFLLLSFVSFYVWRLATLTRGLSPAESAARANTFSIHRVLDNPINLPQKLLQLTAQKLGYHGAFSMRLSSVIIALLFLIAMFWLMRTWFGVTAGLAAALIFATTPLVVLLARSATSDVMLLAPAAVLAAYVRLSRHETKPDRPWLLLVIVCSAALYVPGMIWLLGAGVFFTRKKMLAIAKAIQRKTLVVSGALAAVIILPMIWALVRNINLYHDLLLIPARWGQPVAIFKSIGWMALALVWRTPHFNPLIVGRLPILDGVLVCLVVFGAYVMWTRARREMSVILAVLVFSIIVAGINNNLLLLALGLPGLAVLVGAGLRYLYAEWRGIFPKNPIPLSFAWILIVLVVSLQMAYGFRYTLVAWPNTTATKTLYVLK